ncbi:hypothetical protein BCR43DRAFT_483669 [Syncephalastrum racemosum]|uniref:HECT-type E3 ubiquitin transferase n=1 Tax=Syncephalastrum racemosum TaxID=13706 RepID=A0A1X2HVP1_SYNRA|nr:hypothetical protein BCR43DRAFT_483669 [Syncephalastrum racemosum]
MFIPSDKEKKSFVDRTREERQRREAQRQEKQRTEAADRAARVLQRWWKGHKRRQKALNDAWTFWATLSCQDACPHDLFLKMGLYAFLSRKQAAPSSKYLSDLSKSLTAKAKTCLALLVDPARGTRALDYLCFVIQQCLDCTCQGTTDTDFYVAGPELTLLLYYLNPKSYQSLSAQAETTISSIYTTCLFPFDLTKPMVKRIERIAKLEYRTQKYGCTIEDDKKRHQSYVLWMTTFVRLAAFPLENGHQNVDALHYFCTKVLCVPLVTKSINPLIASHVGTLVRPAIVYKYLKTRDWTEQLSGNGCLFLLANLLELDRHDMDLVTLASFLLGHAQKSFSNQQKPPYLQYHPLFKWSCARWGNTIDVIVFERVQAQMEYFWSRTLVDQLFTPITTFQAPVIQKVNKDAKRPWYKKKDQQTQPALDSKTYTQLANLSVDVENTFHMYNQLCSLFEAQQKEILNRIAFTTNLMPQLWKAMNSFGPKGGMVIYLDAARRKDGHVEKEPLIQTLRVFCEACSLVFLTLDDTDIFEKETPFSARDLIQVSGFLNTFYFALLHQSIPSPPSGDASTAPLPPALSRFYAARRLLLQIYDLDVRHAFCPEGHWQLVSDPLAKQSFLSLFSSRSASVSPFLEQLHQGDPVPMRILQLMPHTVSFQTRLKIFRDWVALDRANLMLTSHRTVRVRRQYVLEDGHRGLSGLPPAAWKGNIKVTFVNELGVEEAGIDQGGPFKDFVSLLINEVFKPSFSLFESTTGTNLFYPSPTSSIHGTNHINLFEFIGKVIGKAVYEGILLDVQFASFLLAKLLGRNVFLEELRELDEDVWRNLTFLKHYEGDVADLGLYFATDVHVSGKIVTHELKFHGKSIAVTNDNKIEYVYRMADYKLNQQGREQTRAFVQGFRSVISGNWIKMFSPPELQRVISGEDKDFDVSDLRSHTQYQNGYFDQHPIIRSLWQILDEFSSEDKRAFLKFVTSCPKPPLGGFDYLMPGFTIRMVPVEADGRRGVDGLNLVKSLLKVNPAENARQGRLPTSSTCFNLLKLPAYTKKSILREKLHYAIHSNTGFELS